MRVHSRSVYLFFFGEAVERKLAAGMGARVGEGGVVVKGVWPGGPQALACRILRP